jgi:monoamine oxidase
MSMTESPSRRDVLKLAAGAAVLPFTGQPRASKRVIVGGGGIGGLCCGYELMRRGHDVIVLEASSRTGGHVRTVREGLADGLYVDAGAEQFTQPGYERYWEYVREFDLPYLYYPRRERILQWIGGRMYTPEMLADPTVLASFGFNPREIDTIVRTTLRELPWMYYQPYLDRFEDEYRPFDAGLDHLDALTQSELLKKEGASAAAVRWFGGDGSALQQLWYAAILKTRGVPLFPPKVFRLRGGNERLPDTFAARLGDRVRLDSPVTRIEHGSTGVRVHCGANGNARVEEGDFLVCAMSAVMLSRIDVSPAWPPEKAWALSRVPYYFDTRVILQSKTRFWTRENLSPNMEFNDPALAHAWSTGEEVDTPRGLIVGTASGAGSPDAALRAYRKHYPGTLEDIDRADVHVWAADPWASACERTDYRPGELKKFWPTLIEPQGRVHFVGAYADNLNWGMEAATRSANRVAEAIHNS